MRLSEAEVVAIDEVPLNTQIEDSVMGVWDRGSARQLSDCLNSTQNLSDSLSEF